MLFVHQPGSRQQTSIGLILLTSGYQTVFTAWARWLRSWCWASFPYNRFSSQHTTNIETWDIFDKKSKKSRLYDALMVNVLCMDSKPPSRSSKLHEKTVLGTRSNSSIHPFKQHILNVRIDWPLIFDLEREKTTPLTLSAIRCQRLQPETLFPRKHVDCLSHQQKIWRKDKHVFKINN